MNRLLIPRGNRQSVEKVLDDIRAQHQHKIYDPCRSLSRRGRHHAKGGQNLILNCQTSKISITQTTIMLNDFSIQRHSSKRYSIVNGD